MDGFGGGVRGPRSPNHSRMLAVGVGKSPSVWRDVSQTHRAGAVVGGERSTGIDRRFATRNRHVHHESARGGGARQWASFCGRRVAKEIDDYWLGGRFNAEIRGEFAHETASSGGVELGALAGPKRTGELAVLIGGVKSDSAPDLPHVSDGFGLIAQRSRGVHGRQSQRRQDGHHRNGDEQLQECECHARAWFFIFPSRSQGLRERGARSCRGC